MGSTRLDRRTFLKGAGVGSIALVGVPAVVTMGATPALAAGDDTIRFFFAALSSAGTPAGTMTKDTLVMQGCGDFEPTEGEITGRGFFTHYDATTSKPFTIKASGQWKAEQFVSFTSIGMYGVQFAGILKAKVKLERQVPEPELDIPADLTVVCNIPQVPLLTGMDEGFQLVVASLGLTFMPLTPTLGISGFSHNLDD